MNILIYTVFFGHGFIYDEIRQRVKIQNRGILFNQICHQSGEAAPFIYHRQSLSLFRVTWFQLLVVEGAIHAVRLKQKSKTKRKKKIAAAIYEYQADCDSEWGEISLNFEDSTAEIVRLADWDTVKTNRFAKKAMAYLLNCENEKLPKETIAAFEPKKKYRCNVHPARG